MTKIRPVIRGILYGGLLYLGMYGVARATHQLVRNQDGCVSRPGGGFLDPVPSCADLQLIDRMKGRTIWQIAFRPLVWVEERVRGPAVPHTNSAP